MRLQLRPFGSRTLSWGRSVAPSCWLLARSGSTLRLSSRRMPRGPFQTNLAGLGWSRSSGLINLLFVILAASAASRCPSLRIQRPHRASRAVAGPNFFLLHPTAFHYTWEQGSGGSARSGLTGDNDLLFSDLRTFDFRAFFVAIARLLCTPASQESSAIRRPNVSPQVKTTENRFAWTYANE